MILGLRSMILIILVIVVTEMFHTLIEAPTRKQLAATERTEFLEATEVVDLPLESVAIPTTF